MANNAFLTGFVLHAVAPGPLGLTPAQYGLLLSATGVGAGLGALLTGRLERRVGPARLMWLSRAGWAGWAATMAGPLAVREPALWLVMVVGSALGGTYGVQAMRIRQRAVAPHERGQVFGASRMLSYGAAPAGAVLGGLAPSAMPPTTLFALCAGTTLATIVPLAAWLSPDPAGGAGGS